MTAPEWSNGHIVNGKYTIQSVLGRSGRSRTYAAITDPNREIVLYVVGPDDAATLDPVVDRIMRATALNDPSTLRAVDVGRDEESGARFAALVSLCPLSFPEAVSFAHKLARALSAAHTAGAAALELRPTTVFLGPMPDGAVQITTVPMPPVGVVSLDRLLWCAPEQLETGGLAGPPADVFTGALLVFYALTGKPYWVATTAELLREEHKGTRVPVSKRAAELGVTLPKMVDMAFARALDKDPAKRQHDLVALAAALGPAVPTASGTTIPTRSVVPPSALAAEPAVIIADDVPAVAAPAAPPVLAPPVLAPPVLAPPILDVPIGAPPLQAPPIKVSTPTSIDAPQELPSGPALRDFPPPAPPWSQPNVSEQSAPETARRSRGLPWAILVGAAGGVALFAIVGLVLILHKPTPKGTTSLTSATVTPTTTTPATATSAVPEPVDAATQIADSGPPLLALGPNESELRVVCEPVPCSLVLVDKKKMTSYPDSMKVPPGPHGVGINAKGYWGDWQLVTTAAGEHATVLFKLKTRPPPPPTANPRRR
jgi:hypothetical protein